MRARAGRHCCGWARYHDRKGSAERPHPLQQAFLDEQAGQCGYRLSGIIMSAIADQSVADTRRDRASAQEPLSLRRAPADPACGREGCGHAAGKDRRMSDTPRRCRSRITDGWRSGSGSSRIVLVRLVVGKVELGQGNVTALAQIAADESMNLDRISVLSGDTQDAPDEGQTTSSQSRKCRGRLVRDWCRRSCVCSRAGPVGT